MEKYKRKAVFCELMKHDVFANKNHYIEVTLWHNGEGFDVEINSNKPTRFELTFGEWELLKKMVKKLDS